jgi:hypothetical protein
MKQELCTTSALVVQGKDVKLTDEKHFVYFLFNGNYMFPINALQNKEMSM